MPDPHRIKRELQEILSRPQFAALFAHRNQFRNPLDRAGKPSLPDTPESIATGTADHLWKNNPLMDPIEILELRGPVELYRTHDGGAGKRTARTLGGSWVERSIVETIWKGTSKYPAAERSKWFMDFMRTANFVLPEWNAMLFVVCMRVPAGASVVVARGRGSWKAMKTPVGGSRPGGAAPIHNTGDVLREGMMPMPGLVQCLVPLLDDMWIQPVNPKAATWPLLT